MISYDKYWPRYVKHVCIQNRPCVEVAFIVIARIINSSEDKLRYDSQSNALYNGLACNALTYFYSKWHIGDFKSVASFSQERYFENWSIPLRKKKKVKYVITNLKYATITPLNKAMKRSNKIRTLVNIIKITREIFIRWPAKSTINLASFYVTFLVIYSHNVYGIVMLHSFCQLLCVSYQHAVL